MATEAKEVRLYKLDAYDVLFNSIEEALAYDKKEKAKLAIISKRNEKFKLEKEERYRKDNWLRNNLSDINDFPRLLTEKCKEWYNIDVTELSLNLTFGENISNTHSSPIDGARNWDFGNDSLPKGYPGWVGRITGSFSSQAFSHKSISDFLKEYFVCINTGTGCGGRFDEFSIFIGISLFLQDFPLLREKYSLFKEENANVNLNYKQQNDLAYKAIQFARKDELLLNIEREIVNLREYRDELEADLIEKYNKENPFIPIEISEEYNSLANMFGCNRQYV